MKYQHPFGHTRGASEIILTNPIYRFVAGGEPAPGQNPPVISPSVGIFRRIGVGAEIRAQNPVLSNTRLAKMVPLSHLRRQFHHKCCEDLGFNTFLGRPWPGSVGALITLVIYVASNQNSAA
jgi:hypothetical protein